MAPGTPSCLNRTVQVLIGQMAHAAGGVKGFRGRHRRLWAAAVMAVTVPDRTWTLKEWAERRTTFASPHHLLHATGTSLIGHIASPNTGWLRLRDAMAAGGATFRSGHGEDDSHHRRRAPRHRARIFLLL